MPVGAFVVPADPLGLLGGEHAFDDRGAERRVLLDALVFPGGQASLFEQDRVGNPDRSDVAQQRGLVQPQPRKAMAGRSGNHVSGVGVRGELSAQPVQQASVRGGVAQRG